ncbi:N-6 DNA methylase [Vagococcus carniphilus]|uniref:N-6 DNA methylase n=1 Tax=Vagococcus carniphilus TaxID=218144 RepID=UPI0028908D78|nr:N-6 DNA methylase [Vagococcus carniphilus]MDT2864648.1 N-6 DNA methylase [Vagococcus carniphilus]
MKEATTKSINQLLNIKESYQASDKLMSILFDKKEREELFKNFLDQSWDITQDWFHIYFQDEHADRKMKKQDFTPSSISEIIVKMLGSENDNGTRLDVAAGTGGITIQKWFDDRKSVPFFDYRPSQFIYQCEELSDRALPFLLFNLSIRGMNAVVLHGDALTREFKQVYFIQNDIDDYLCFSSINVFPHNKMVERSFDVKKWIDEPVDYIESPVFDWMKGAV